MHFSGRFARSQKEFLVYGCTVPSTGGPRLGPLGRVTIEIFNNKGSRQEQFYQRKKKKTEK